MVRSRVQIVAWVTLENKSPFTFKRVWISVIRSCMRLSECYSFIVQLATGLLSSQRVQMVSDWYQVCRRYWIEKRFEHFVSRVEKALHKSIIIPITFCKAKKQSKNLPINLHQSAKSPDLNLLLGLLLLRILSSTSWELYALFCRRVLSSTTREL